jgi:hypothetical protein
VNLPPFTNIAHGARRRLVALHRASRTALLGHGSAMHGVEPDLWRNLQRDVLAGRQWMV